jgi:hypothetical protein
MIYLEEQQTSRLRADLSSRTGLLIKLKEWERLARVVETTPRERLMVLSHYTTELAAEKLVKSHRLLAAKLRVAMGLRIVEAKKSKYDGAAQGHFEELVEGRSSRDEPSFLDRAKKNWGRDGRRRSL